MSDTNKTVCLGSVKRKDKQKNAHNTKRKRKNRAWLSSPSHKSSENGSLTRMKQTYAVLFVWEGWWGCFCTFCLKSVVSGYL